MLNAETWEYPNQFNQEGAIPSPPLRAQVLLRNYYLCARSSMEQTLDVVVKLRLIREASKHSLDEEMITFNELEAKMGKKVKIFTFGSLLHPISAKFNLKSHGKPALSFGLKRIFNYGKGDFSKNSLGLPSPDHPLEFARLNVVPTGDLSDFLPGALFEIDREELESLKEREQGYYLRKVLIVDYNAAVEGKKFTIEEAYTLMLPKEEERYDALPHQNYLNVCLEGAKKFGTRFLKLFAETTYLSDGCTTILEWLRNEVVFTNLSLIPTVN